MRNSILRLTATCILWLLLTADSGLAQKKGASGGPSAAAPPATLSPGASASNGPFEEGMLAYTAMDAVLERLAHFACEKASNSYPLYSGILVLDSTALGALQSYDGFYENTEVLKQAFRRMINPAGGGSGIDDFADITNAVAAAATASTSEAASSFTIQDPTPALAFMRHLQRHKDLPGCPPAYYAGVYSPEVTKIKTIDGAKAVENVEDDGGEKAADASSPTLNGVTVELGQLALVRSQTFRTLMGKAVAIRPAEVKKSEPAAGNGDAETAKPIDPAIVNVPKISVPSGFACVPTLTPVANSNPAVYTVSAQDPCIAAFNNIDNTYNAFLAGLNTATGTGQPGVAAILQGYRVHTQFRSATDAAPMLCVYVNVAAAGGTQQDRKNLLTNLFTGDWIRYSGGVSVNFVVFRIGGAASQVLVSDIVRYRTPLGKIRKPKGYKTAGNSGDNLDTIPEQ